MRRLRAAWAAARARAKARAFPPGSVTFHLGAWSRGALLEGEAAEARGLLEAFGFHRLLVLHGSAMSVQGETVLVVGARGIGKSSACRELHRRGEGTCLEDGLLVVGEAGGRWVLVETGTLGVLGRAARLESGMRRLLPRPSGPARPGGEGAGSFRARLHRALDVQAFRAGLLLAGREPAGKARRLHAVDRVVVAEEAASPSGSFETDGRALREIADTASLAPPGCDLRVVATSGPLAEVVARLAAAMRG